MQFEEMFPFPSLRSMAFQALVINNYPTDQFEEQLPGNGYSTEHENLENLTRDCVGTYMFRSVEDNVFLSGRELGNEVTEEEKKRNFRDDDYNFGVREAIKN